MMFAVGALLATVLAAAAPGPGTGFGEALRNQASACRAGSGGLPLEDYLVSGLSAEVFQNYLGVDVRWAGLGVEATLWQGTRLGARGAGTFSEGIPATTELADGSFGGTTGTVRAEEWTWTVFAQQRWTTPTGGRIDARLTGLGIRQDLAGDAATGAGIAAAAFVALPVSAAATFLAWGEAGPFGRGRGAGFAQSVRFGFGLERQGGIGLVGGQEGFRLGGEGEGLLEGLWDAGGGLVYWFGGRAADGPGMRLFLRGGARSMGAGVTALQPRFGFGASLLTEGNFGIAADYAAVPFGDFGVMQSLTARITFAGRLAGGRAEPSHTLQGP
ncbi:MAG: hypothetical protein AAB368_05360 [bacterium]